MGGAACVVIINGNKAYASVEELGEKYKHVNTYFLEAAINASCAVVPYASLYLRSIHSYLNNSFMQPIIDLHERINTELPLVSKENAQSLVYELGNLLFSASNAIADAVEE